MTSVREVFDTMEYGPAPEGDKPAREWLDKKTLGSPGWPSLILEWQGVPDVPPFESYRGELLPPREDAFS